MTIVSVCVCLLWALLFIWKSSYLWELVISFLPYAMTVFFIGFLYRLFQLWRILYTKPTKNGKMFQFAPIFLIGFGVLFGRSSWNIQQFYNHKIGVKDEIGTPIRIFFSNLYKENLNFEAIKTKILTEKPDIVMFVEFSDKHKQGLQAFFDQQYPYMNTTTRSKIFVGSVVFSKYPITNLADDFEQGSWRYGYFSIEKDQQTYYFYEIHTTSPVTKPYFEKRNLQLKQLKTEFLTLHKATRPKNAKIVMVGDFNVSPWSTYYQEFADSLSGEVENITKRFPILFTRSFSEMISMQKDINYLPQSIKKMIGKVPFLRSHIDHVFASQGVNVWDIKTIQIWGSDHRGFVFDIE